MGMLLLLPTWYGCDWCTSTPPRTPTHTFPQHTHIPTPTTHSQAVLLLIEVMDGDGVLLNLAQQQQQQDQQQQQQQHPPSSTSQRQQPSLGLLFADTTAYEKTDEELSSWLQGGAGAPVTPHQALVLLAWGAVVRLLKSVQGVCVYFGCVGLRRT